MKLGTYHDGSRDGQLLVVARDLQTAHYAGGIVGRLQAALEDWGFFGPQLQDLYDALNAGQARHAFPFEPARCLAPLPRSALCVAGQAYAAPGEEGDPTAAPTLAAGTALRGPRGQIVWPDGQPAPDFGATLLALTGDVPPWATAEQALDGVRLLALAVQIDTAPALTACAPVAITPDELGTGWRDGRAQGSLQTTLNGRKLGLGDSAAGMAKGFGQLMAEAAQRWPITAGSVIGSGTVRHPPQGQRHWPLGAHRLADRRAIEALQGHALDRALGLQAGDELRVDWKGADGQSLCGAIVWRAGAAPADEKP